MCFTSNLLKQLIIESTRLEKTVRLSSPAITYTRYLCPSTSLLFSLTLPFSALFPILTSFSFFFLQNRCIPVPVTGSMLNGRCAQQPTALSGMAHTNWHCKMSVSFVPHNKRRDEKILAEPSGQEDWLLSLLLVIKLPFSTTFPLANPRTADL